MGEEHTVIFEAGRNGSVLCRINGRIGFIHNTYTGRLPLPGETWTVEVAGGVPSKTDPNKGTYFVKPLSIVRRGVSRPVTEYHALISEVTGDPEIYQDCLAAIRCGAVAPNRLALQEWLRGLVIRDERAYHIARERAAIARDILRKYGFKIVREFAAPSGDFLFVTHEQYRGFWATGYEGKVLILKTTFTTGYVLTESESGWYVAADAQDDLPPELPLNWRGNGIGVLGIYA